MLSKALLAAAKAVEPVYVEDVFSTWLYTGNGSTQTITNGIDLSGKGGLVWIKSRSAADYGSLYDTARGATKWLIPSLTNAQGTWSTSVTSFNANGFTTGDEAYTNTSNYTYASWTFRKAAKFFDVATFTANSSGVGTFSHSLGATPGTVIIKRTDGAENWLFWHRSLSANGVLVLNSTGAEINLGTPLFTTLNTTTVTTAAGMLNTSGSATYVAYLFAHDAGGFGDSGNDSVVKCGSYTGTGSAPLSVTLGWEPQWVLIKRTDFTSNWFLFDSMRGIATGGDDFYLVPNSSNAETYLDALSLTATGFDITNGSGSFNASGGTYIYIAIRRGPMKTPTDATKVFSTVRQAGGGAVSTGFPVDTVFNTLPSLGVDKLVRSRLTGGFQQLATSSTAAETTEAGQFNFASNASLIDQYFGSGNQVIYECFRRAPGFFDVVCYDGSGATATTQTHNLGAAPEFMIIKSRNTGSTSWVCYHKGVNGGVNPQNYYMLLQSDQAQTALTSVFNDTAPTSSVFTVGPQGSVGASGRTYVAYLFATLAGISKVGSYTGTGTTQQINCGFTAGARFVLIKRTDSTGDWYVWDSARGIVAGNDPYLLLNSTAAEVTGTDYVDTFSAGFEISSTAPAAINANGGSFIFLAVA